MRQLLGKINDWIYGKTGAFDNIFLSLPVILAVMLIFWFVRRALQKHKLGAEFKDNRRRALLNEIIRLLLVGWIAGTVCSTLTPSFFWQGIWLSIIDGESPGRIWEFALNRPQLIPTIFGLINEGHLEWLFYSKTLIVEFAVNVALFVPLGLALPFVCKKISLLKATLIGFSGSFLIELLQCFIDNRDSSIDDLICNTLGAVIGYLLYLLIKRLFPKFTEKGKETIKARSV